MSLKQSVADVLGFRIEKDMQTSDWAAEVISDEQIEYERSLDVVASLRLHKVLVEELVKKSVEVDSPIPKAWYSFNTKAGEPTRMKRGADNTEIVADSWVTRNEKQFEYEKIEAKKEEGNHNTDR
ncbi:hypothetical protein C8F04DRAFT_1178378 [Mycena alexandri]|uniref:3'-5' exonuclease domain-containing protein n=1 Tax=Mycena alexandri TaxID=1745969 RepID=A0AAD6T908_9AGAR|nr:hypothetical protein C8F04DRAFT_1178378 [Mycena alexandri]